ncbi:glycosyltransferase [Hyalangium gracile]|uniref:glycosyltransferase n=1 Tax=Hyalangium gracile TaxID=394092 RepID=UPI001CC94CD6|nr:glycosyltransferase [Hyalangium gracile]
MHATLYHQLQGLYVAGDVLCAVDCARALPEYRHVFFINRDAWLSTELLAQVEGQGIEVRRNSLVTEDDVTPALRGVFYHCVGNDERLRGEYVRFREAPPGVMLCAWLHTPGLCGAWVERYHHLRGRAVSRLVFASSFSLHNTPGVELQDFESCSIIHPRVDTERYGAVRRAEDGTFRIGRWSRGDDSKYSDDFLELLSSIDIPDSEFVCMGIPGKFRGVSLPPRVRFLENGAVPVEQLLSRLDVLLFKTDEATWHEGWCRTVTEAMAAGVVPVVENRGGLVDQVIHGHNGFLCDSNEEFKRYCELLHREPERRLRMSANARTFASRNLGLKQLRGDLLRLLEPQAARRLNFGYEPDMRSGYLNFSPKPLPGFDVSAELNPFNPRLPFEDDAFDEIVAHHVLEHVAHKVQILEELWRIARHNAVIRIRLPDRHHDEAFRDPTHLSYWDVDSIDYFVPGNRRSHALARFGVLRKHTNGHEIDWELLALRHRRA